MRLKIRPEDVNALEVSDWLARLRDEVSGETGGDETDPAALGEADSGRHRKQPA